MGSGASRAMICSRRPEVRATEGAATEASSGSAPRSPPREPAPGASPRDFPASPPRKHARARESETESETATRWTVLTLRVELVPLLGLCQGKKTGRAVYTQIMHLVLTCSLRFPGSCSFHDRQFGSTLSIWLLFPARLGPGMRFAVPIRCSSMFPPLRWELVARAS